MPYNKQNIKSMVTVEIDETTAKGKRLLKELSLCNEVIIHNDALIGGIETECTWEELKSELKEDFKKHYGVEYDSI